MGGGDLNMKKSWHPVLMKNQEKVWLKEKEALEEKKKLDQLRKEKEEERQLQELQRLQEEQTGRKRTEKLEWMYTTPATGTTTNESELEDYLLGKKRVDRILTADENAKLGASHSNFIAVQNANNARDVAAKIREDPLLAIKRQEAEALERLRSNPLLLREARAHAGLPALDKKAEKRKAKEARKAEKHARKEERRAERARDASPHDSGYRSRSRYDDDRDDYRSRSRYGEKDDRRSDSRDARRPPWPRSDESASPPLRERERGRRDDDRKRTRSRSCSPYEERKRARMSPPPPPARVSRLPASSYDRGGPGSASYDRDSRAPRDRSPPPRQRSPPPARDRAPPPAPAPAQSTASRAEADRAARLAAMQGNAQSMDAERRVRLSAMLEQEKAEAAREDAERARSAGGSAAFLSAESKRVFGGVGDLGDRLKRGRAGLVRESY